MAAPQPCCQLEPGWALQRQWLLYQAELYNHTDRLNTVLDSILNAGMAWSTIDTGNSSCCEHVHYGTVHHCQHAIGINC